MRNPFSHTGAAAPKLAVPRARALERVLFHLKRGEYVSLLAPFQSGKTTFINRDLLPILVKKQYRVCRLDLQHVYEPAVLPAFRETCRPHSLPMGAADPDDPKWGFDLKDWLSHGIGAQRTVFLLDELPKNPVVATYLLSNIRAYFNEAKDQSAALLHQFVFASSDDIINLTNSDAALSSGFNIVHEVLLDDFTRAESSELILRLTRRTDRAALFDDCTIDRIFELTEGHPYLVQFLCFWIVEHPEQRNAVLDSAKAAVELCRIDASPNARAMMARLDRDDGMAKERRLLADLVLEGRPVNFTATVQAHRTLQLQGCIRDRDGLCAVRNPIYEAIFRKFFQAGHRTGASAGQEKIGEFLPPPSEARLLADVRALLKAIIPGDAQRNSNLLSRTFRGHDPDPSGHLDREGTPEDLATAWTQELREYKCLGGRSPLSLLLEEGYRTRREPKPPHFASFGELLKALDSPCGGQSSADAT